MNKHCIKVFKWMACTGGRAVPKTEELMAPVTESATLSTEAEAFQVVTEEVVTTTTMVPTEVPTMATTSKQ